MIKLSSISCFYRNDDIIKGIGITIEGGDLDETANKIKECVKKLDIRVNSETNKEEYIEIIIKETINEVITELKTEVSDKKVIMLFSLVQWLEENKFLVTDNFNGMVYAYS